MREWLSLLSGDPRTFACLPGIFVFSFVRKAVLVLSTKHGKWIKQECKILTMDLKTGCYVKNANFWFLFSLKKSDQWARRKRKQGLLEIMGSLRLIFSNLFCFLSSPPPCLLLLSPFFQVMLYWWNEQMLYFQGLYSPSFFG